MLLIKGVWHLGLRFDWSRKACNQRAVCSRIVVIALGALVLPVVVGRASTTPSQINKAPFPEHSVVAGRASITHSQINKAPFPEGLALPHTI